MGSKTSAVAASRASGQQQMQVFAATNFTLAEYRPHGVLSSRGASGMTRTDACREWKGWVAMPKADQLCGSGVRADAVTAAFGRTVPPGDNFS
jgi:hypothetical protein